MKTIKTLFWVIILAVLGILIYQNQDYFLATQSLTFDIKVYKWDLVHWVIPEIPNVAYFGICFSLSLILVGLKWIVTNFKANRKIKSLNSSINSKDEKIKSLENELHVFKNDPYLKKSIPASAEMDDTLPIETLVVDKDATLQVEKKTNDPDENSSTE
jgi:hypothetical protein